MDNSAQDNKAIARQKIRELVNRFRNDPLITTYNEAQIYKDYVLPLFSALGWDVTSREVTIEETVGRKRADFGFYIKTESRGYLPVFYLEIKHNKQPLTPENHQQATNYAYLKGITWAVLTNFAEIAVHNAEFPREFFRLSYEDYAEDSFEDLWLLSKVAFQKGLLDKKAENYGVKAKIKPV
ncbi:MAG: type I restriction enzyme HsdR N-terminal domain-containing protein, partial [Anaerolineae bacterium]|nr:type I restriction enzyme HsdR N-terminal domain-containing protein [Anaerolineae bacterium]